MTSWGPVPAELLRGFGKTLAHLSVYKTFASQGSCRPVEANCNCPQAVCRVTCPACPAATAGLSAIEVALAAFLGYCAFVLCIGLLTWIIFTIYQAKNEKGGDLSVKVYHGGHPDRHHDRAGSSREVPRVRPLA